MGVACGLLGETDVAGRVGAMARSERSLGFVELETQREGRERKFQRPVYAYETEEDVRSGSTLMSNKLFCEICRYGISVLLALLALSRRASRG